MIRVRLLQNQEQVTLTTSHPPKVIAGSAAAARTLEAAPGAPIVVALSAGGWRIGGIDAGVGDLAIYPSVDGSVSINGLAYRGMYRLVPTAAGRFDVVNVLPIDPYLKSVVSKELLWNWAEETYRAQAIVARTYALYQARTAGLGRHYDVNNDQRSQVYGGIAAETARSRSAVDATAGIVLAYGRPGSERIFETYFSSCCGGITQSAADAFGTSPIPPLSEQDAQSLCNAAPRYNWGPLVIKKDELTRRFRAWGAKRDRPEKDMAPLDRIEIAQVNRFGRPVRFTAIDSCGQGYSWTGEEIRWAINTEAQEGSTVYSSFFKPINEKDQVQFADGHGWGHGVGMCQWCAQRRAELGMRHEQIVLKAYPQAVLVRAY